MSGGRGAGAYSTGAPTTVHAALLRLSFDRPLYAGEPYRNHNGRSPVHVVPFEEVMMVPTPRGKRLTERAFKQLSEQFPYMRMTKIPRSADMGAIAVRADFTVVILVIDEANDVRREYELHPSLLTDPPRAIRGAERALHAPFN